MNDALQNLWLKIAERMRLFAPGSGGRESNSPLPGESCLAREYAGCSDSAHCPTCPALEQIMRTATWADRNWRRMQYCPDTKRQTAPGSAQ